MRFTTQDVIQHIVKFGVDVYPPIEIAKERTRLNLFFEEARDRFGRLYEEIQASDTAFQLSKSFGAGLRGPTFVLTNRGPVFIFPLRLPKPGGGSSPVLVDTGLEDNYVEQFHSVRSLFARAIPDRKIMRLGLIRELIMDCGDSPANSVLSTRAEFSGASLSGGRLLLAYRDSQCNVRITVQPGEFMQTVKLPVGTSVTQRQSYVLHVELDVNNAEVRPLEDADITTVLDRATSLWPGELLNYLAGEGKGEES